MLPTPQKTQTTIPTKIYRLPGNGLKSTSLRNQSSNSQEAAFKTLFYPFQTFRPFATADVTMNAVNNIKSNNISTFTGTLITALGKQVFNFNMMPLYPFFKVNLLMLVLYVLHSD